MPSWYLVPALLCGNAVVWKPADYAAALGDALTRLFVAGGLPPGVLNTVHADGPTTFDGLRAALDAGPGATRSASPAPPRSAPGSASCAGRHLQSACLELGGKNPLVVMPDADLDLAAEGALFSGFGTAGQRCTSLGVAIVHDDVHDAFLRAAPRPAWRRPRVGDPTRGRAVRPDARPSASSPGFEKWLGEMQPHHTVHGATGRITSDNPREGFVGDPDAGRVRPPGRRQRGAAASDALYRHETFGPLVPVMRFRTLRRGRRAGQRPRLRPVRAPSTPATRPTAFRFRERVSAGMLSVNNSTSGAEAHLPFGGNGKSGNGSRQSGVWVLDQFTRWQSMNWDYAGRLQKAQMDVEQGTSGALHDPDLRL